MSGEVAFPTLNYVLNRGPTDENGQDGRRFQEICGDVLEQAQILADSVGEIPPEVTADLEEHWQNYQKRLETFDPAFSYPAGVTPVKCALAGWIYPEEAKIRCDDCRAHLALRPAADEVDVQQFGRRLLSSLHKTHDKLCPWRVGRTFELPAYSVAENIDAIRALVPTGQVDCAPIKLEFMTFSSTCAVTPDFALYYAVAGWRACNKKLHCDYCMNWLDVSTVDQRPLDPLKLHRPYCPILEAYPLWKLAIEEYVQMHSDPTSLNDNFALIQKQLANADLLNEATPEEANAPEMAAESGTAELSRSIETAVSIDEVQEAPPAPQPLRDVDFEEVVAERSRKRLRERAEAAEMPMEGVEAGPKRQRRNFPVLSLTESIGNTWELSADRVEHATAADPLARAANPVEEVPIDSPVPAFHAEDTPRSPIEEAEEESNPPAEIHEEEEGLAIEEHPADEEAEDEGIDESVEYGEEVDEEESGEVEAADGAQIDGPTASNHPLDESVQVIEEEEPEEDADSGAEDEAEEDERAQDYGEYDDYEEEEEGENDESPQNDVNGAAGDASDSDSDIICLD